jgi:hypothetical protein
VAYSPEATLALITSAISVGNVMLSCWVVAGKTAAVSRRHEARL